MIRSKNLKKWLLTCWVLMFMIPTITSFKLAPSQTYTITVVVKNIRNKKGQLQLQLYQNPEQYEKQTPLKQAKISKENMKNSMITYKFSGLTKGIYGVALLDDEDRDGKMDYSWMTPAEGFGFSDYYHTAWSKPKFQHFMFGLKEDKKVYVKIRYM